MPPILVKYKRTLDSRFDSIDSETILQFFKQAFRKQGVNHFELKEDSSLEFRIEGSWLMSNWNIWNGINRGNIEIRQSGNQRELICEIDMTRSLIIAAVTVLAFLITLIIVFKGFYITSLLVLFPFIFAAIITWVRHEDNITGTLNDLLKFQSKKVKIN